MGTPSWENSSSLVLSSVSPEHLHSCGTYKTNMVGVPGYILPGPSELGFFRLTWLAFIGGHSMRPL